MPNSEASIFTQARTKYHMQIKNCLENELWDSLKIWGSSTWLINKIALFTQGIKWTLK